MINVSPVFTETVGIVLKLKYDINEEPTEMSVFTDFVRVFMSDGVSYDIPYSKLELVRKIIFD